MADTTCCVRPTQWLRVVAAAMALSVTACALGPDYVEPQIHHPAAFKYQDGWQTVPDRPWDAQGQWWQAFEDPLLNQLIDKAMSANQTLAQAEARYRAAEAQLAGARSEFWPTLDGSVSGTRSGGDNSATEERFSARLSASWAPDLWGRVRRQVEAQRAGLQGSGADLKAAQLSIQLAVAQSYIRLRALDLQRDILEQTQRSYDRSYTLTSNQYRAGIVARSDVIQADTQRQSLIADLLDLQNQRALEENTLAVLLGEAPVNYALAPDSAIPQVPGLPEVLPAALIARRPDVVAAERRLAAANAQVGVAHSAWLPSFSISASQGVEAARFRDLFDAPAMVWSVGPSVLQALFDGGARRAGVAEAEAQYQQQLAVYRQTVLEGLAEVESALATIGLLLEQSRQQDQLVALAEENERIVTNRYEAGMVSFLEVASAQNITLNAKRSRLATTASRLQAALQLAAVVGGAWSADDPVVQSVLPIELVGD